MHIYWKIKRLDENYEQSPAEGECLIEIEGTIECDGQPAGSVDAFYLFAENPELPAAFLEFWDMDSGTCAVFEEIMRPDHQDFRDPLPDFLCVCAGILCVNFIALYPQFRRRGLGREVMRELVRNFTDDRLGVVLLNAQPLQHLPHGYDHFGDEVRELPWNSPDEDLERLIVHFHTWGMQHLPGTRFLLAAPEFLCEEPATDWYPGLLGDTGEE